MICPNCGAQNIAGSDLCEDCGTDLAGLDLPEAGAGFEGRLMTERLALVELTAPLSVGFDATVGEAIDRMREARHGCVLVQRGADLVGIFTERDLLTRVLLTGADPDATPISGVMTAEPATVTPDDPIAFAMHRMVAQGHRHLPVVSGGRLLGFVSVRNLLAHVHRELLGGEAEPPAG